MRCQELPTLSRLVTNTLFAALLLHSRVAPEKHTESNLPQTLEHLVLVAPTVRGSGWDLVARSMQSALVSCGLAKEVDVRNRAGSRGVDGLMKFSIQYGHDGNALLISGRTLIETASLSTVLNKGCTGRSPHWRIRSDANSSCWRRHSGYRQQQFATK